MKTIKMNIANGEDTVKETCYVSPGMPGEIVIGGFSYDSKVKCIVTFDNMYVGTTEEANNYLTKRVFEELLKKGHINQTGVYEFSGIPYYEIV